MLGPLTTYVKLWVVHAPGIPGTIPLPPTSKETASYRSRHASRHVHHARAVVHVGIANPWWQGKCYRNSRRKRSPQFCVFGKRPIIAIRFAIQHIHRSVWLAESCSAPALWCYERDVSHQNMMYCRSYKCDLPCLRKKIRHQNAMWMSVNFSHKYLFLHKARVGPLNSTLTKTYFNYQTIHLFRQNKNT